MILKDGESVLNGGKDGLTKDGQLWLFSANDDVSILDAGEFQQLSRQRRTRDSRASRSRIHAHLQVFHHAVHLIGEEGRWKKSGDAVSS